MFTCPSDSVAGPDSLDEGPGEDGGGRYGELENERQGKKFILLPHVHLVVTFYCSVADGCPSAPFPTKVK